MKKQLSLEALRVKSFITRKENSAQTVKGGDLVVFQPGVGICTTDGRVLCDENHPLSKATACETSPCCVGTVGTR